MTTEEYKPDVRTLVRCLISEYQWLDLLKNRGKMYEPILDYLACLGKQNRYERCSCDVKQYQANTISDVTGISISKIKKHLTNIYDDILELNSSQPDVFSNGGQYHYVLNFRYFSFTYNDFNVWFSVPLARLDTVEFFFISAKLQTSHFWVEDIRHIHEYGKVSVEVDLKGGFPNVYRELLLSKAEFMHEIDFRDKYQLYDFQIDEKLRKYAIHEKL
jgi:hypothetical protein